MTAARYPLALIAGGALYASHGWACVAIVALIVYALARKGEL
jgi:hypothetical protein